MKTIKTLSAVALGASVMCGMQAQTARADVTDTLAELANGGSLSLGDKTFTGFSYDASGLTSFNASDIQVTVTQSGENYFLNWVGNVSLAGTGVSTADLELGYTVTASQGTIVAIDQSYTGGSDLAAGGAAGLTVTETVSNPHSGSTVASSSLNSAITSTTYTDVGALLQPIGLTSVNVVKDISLAIGGTGFNIVSLSDVEQSFEQTAVPEPTTVLAAALLLLPLGVSAARVIRKGAASI
jgi:hypothetical protein